MWKPWKRSSSKANTTPSSSPKYFRCSSFKDVENLCTEDNDSDVEEENNFSFEPSTTAHNNDTGAAASTTGHQSLNHNQHNQEIPQSPRRPRQNHSSKKIFHRVRTVSSLIRNWPTRPNSPSTTSTNQSHHHHSFNLPLPEQFQHQQNTHQSFNLPLPDHLLHQQNTHQSFNLPLPDHLLHQQTTHQSFNLPLPDQLLHQQTHHQSFNLPHPDELQHQQNHQSCNLPLPDQLKHIQNHDHQHPHPQIDLLHPLSPQQKQQIDDLHTQQKQQQTDDLHPQEPQQKQQQIDDLHPPEEPHQKPQQIDDLHPPQEPQQQPPPSTPPTPISIPGAENRIVIYTTSLHAVRPTFQACRTVQSILAGFRVPIDERDLAMDSGFLDELQTLLGTAPGEELTLPRVFIGGRYIGGAQELNQMDETGELKKLVEGLPDAAPSVCKACGGYRFVLCGVCNGSHKVFSDKVGEFKECTACTQNGLVRCSSCNTIALV